MSTAEVSGHTFKVGNRIEIINQDGRAFCHDRPLELGMKGTVEKCEPSSYYGAHPVYVRFDGSGHLHWPHRLTIALLPTKTAPQTKEQKAIAKAEADLQKLKERAALKEKAAAEKKAKAERAKLLRGLSPAGRRVVGLLRAKSDAFGCQKDNAVALAAAITGDDADKIRKALA